MIPAFSPPAAITPAVICSIKAPLVATKCSYRHGVITTANLVASTGLAVPTKLTTKLWTPRLALAYQPNRDLLLFASATKGFRSGGWNARASSPSTFLPFGPEKVWSYEAGIKAELFDRKVRANLTAFYIDVQDLQSIAGFVNPATGAFTTLTRNFADYRNKGIEAELTVVPIEGMTLFVNAGYQDDRYIIDYNAPAFDEFGVQSVAGQQAACLAALAVGAVSGGPGTSSCGAGIVSPDGSIATPVRTPKFTLSVGGAYKMPLSSGVSLTPSINASYRTKQEVGTSNFNLYDGAITGTNGTFPANTIDGDFITGSKTGASWLVNASLTLRLMDENLQISGECSNCFDKSYSTSLVGNYILLNQPRSWMLRTRYSF